MQKVIVTTSVFTGYSTIFDVDSTDCVDLGYTYASPPPPDFPFTLAVLPFELKYDIIERVVLMLMKQGFIKKAIKVLVGSGYHVCKGFYSRHIGNYNLTRLETANHLMRLFDLINDIYKSLNYMDSTSSEELFLSIYCHNKTIDIERKLEGNVWPFGMMCHSFMDAYPRILEDSRKFLKVITGPTYGDLVWINGVEKDGVIHADYLRGPVVILEIFSRVGGMSHTLFESHTAFFLNFVKILKLCIGEKAGVYTTFPVEGFFCLVSEVA
jgi:hypothetical protein